MRIIFSILSLRVCYKSQTGRASDLSLQGFFPRSVRPLTCHSEGSFHVFAGLIFRCPGVQVLQQSMQASIPAQLQQKVVHCLLHHLQASRQAETQAQPWLVACLAIIAPGSAKSIQSWLQDSHTQQLSDLHMLVMETLQGVLLFLLSPSLQVVESNKCQCMVPRRLVCRFA